MFIINVLNKALPEAASVFIAVMIIYVTKQVPVSTISFEYRQVSCYLHGADLSHFVFKNRFVVCIQPQLQLFSFYLSGKRPQCRPIKWFCDEQVK